MADYDPSAGLAYLQSLQANNAGYSSSNPTPNPQNLAADDEDDDDYDPTNFVTGASIAEPSAPHPTTFTQTQTSDLRSPSMGAPPSGAFSRIAGQDSSAKKPRKVGGFMVEDDDEDDTPVPAVTAGFGHLAQSSAASTPARSTTQTPISTSVSTGIIPKPAAQVSSGHAALASSVPAVPPSPSASVAPNAPNGAAALSLSKARLPQDKVGILEDRIADDPRGDVDAWLELINEYRRRNKLDDARQIYERFFKVFPQAVQQWVAYSKLELDQEDFPRLEKIFSGHLIALPSVDMWKVYLDYVRRRQNLTTDTTGKARQTITQAYETCLQYVGIDKDSGFIWQDYVNFVKSGPGNAGGTTWQDQQKMDSVRKAYQKAVVVPMATQHNLWLEYNKFETEVNSNKVLGRRFIKEKLESYMTAKQVYFEINTITKDLKRDTLPRLPPAPGFDGDQDYQEQHAIWRRWIEREKEDPLVFNEEGDFKAYRDRVVYVYKHALMALRFLPEMWVEAADFCYNNDMEQQGDTFISQGMEANPESCLLAFKHADRLETISANEAGTDPLKRGTAMRAAYGPVLDALYALRKKVDQRGERTMAKVNEVYALQTQAAAEEKAAEAAEDEEDEDEEDEAAKARQASFEAQRRAVEDATTAQIDLIKKTISWTWIALMRAMRRIQGKGGKPSEIATIGGGMRQIFAEARKKGQITADVFVECALMEYQCYRDPAGTKILEKAVKLFPEDETAALAYIKHLIELGDMTNARAVFETVVSRFTADISKKSKAKPLYVFFHNYESIYGELAQVVKLEKRMRDLWPEDPSLGSFAQRFDSTNAQGIAFHPTAVTLIISPATQMRPVHALPVIRSPAVSSVRSPPPTFTVTQSGNSPKRPFDEDNDSDLNPPRKFQRGSSPLKGAAGRRLEAKRLPVAGAGQSGAAPPALPPQIKMFLSILPNSTASNNLMRFKLPELLGAIRNADIARAQTSIDQQNGGPAPNNNPPQSSNGMPPQVQIPQQQLNVPSNTGTPTQTHFPPRGVAPPFPMGVPAQFQGAYGMLPSGSVPPPGQQGAQQQQYAATPPMPFPYAPTPQAQPGGMPGFQGAPAGYWGR